VKLRPLLADHYGQFAFARLPKSLPLGLFSVWARNERGYDRVGSLFEHNRLLDLPVGIAIGRDNCDTVLSGNTFTNVGKPLEDRDTRNLVNEAEGIR